MGPKAFITCYVCSREFGSRSIPFHEPKCLERWRCSNRNLPPEQRSSTPVKPVGWKHDAESSWRCPRCRVSVPSAKRGDHVSNCFKIKGRNGSTRLIGRKIALHTMAAGGAATTATTTTAKNGPSSGSPKKGKENKNSINNNNRKHDCSKTSKVEVKEEPVAAENKESAEDKGDQTVSTSDKSVRPQTKILRRPTPNLKHPVIQVESDHSDSSDKSKDENPKRMKHSECPVEQKPKNFIMYNKYNVERNTKTSPKERSAYAKDCVVAPGSGSIPNPCNSCSRSVAPERLHSHSLRDTRAIMLKKSASSSSSEVKSPSLQKKDLQQDSAAEDKKPKETKLSVEDTGSGSSPKSRDSGSESAKKTLVVPKTASSTPGTKKTLSPPAQTLCYMCGKDPTPLTLMIHEEKCLEKWKRQNGLLSPNRPKVETSKEISDESAELLDKLMVGPQLDDMDPAWLAVQSQLVPCPSCCRTFFPERLPIHQRVCKGKLIPGQSLSRANSLRESSTYQGDEESGDKQSIYVPCYICRRSFGSWVIQMHESQCLRKWRRENEKLPENEQQQEPHKPQLVLDVAQPSAQPSTDASWESHLQQLVPCQRCGRTFFPDRLQVHGRSCKGPASKLLATPRVKVTTANSSKGT